ncbi:MAG: hypothetical protein CM15mP58_00760 [Burkholderiaceae bacterium]|nr:MAG: hypothetical protein CM15mP58_00760 [Burkholderiaceae bacterium]
MRDWVTKCGKYFLHYRTVAGPHPYPKLVRDFNSVVGKECKIQMKDLAGEIPITLLPALGR